MSATNWKTRLSGVPLLWRLVPQPPSPVAWTGLGALTALLGRGLPWRTPPLLVLSLPRSGSSWVGDTLGNAADAMYLREPITQSNMRLHRATQALASVPPEGPDPHTRAYAERAFTGIPDFHAGIVRDPGQWTLPGRRRRRCVIKEVNPLACEWFIRHYRPRVVFIVRHPAAIATSFRRLNWPGSDLDVVRRSLQALTPAPEQLGLFAAPSDDFWRRQGLIQGGALTCAWRALRDYPESRIVDYESLCSRPMETFESLFEFSGLEWDARVRERIAENTRRRTDDDAYSVSRDSRQMRDAWQERIGREELERLHRAYAAFDLPWYREPGDWTLND